MHELLKLPDETEWVEFKHNNAEPQEIGEYISVLSNSAALVGKAGQGAAGGPQVEKALVKTSETAATHPAASRRGIRGVAA